MLSTESSKPDIEFEKIQLENRRLDLEERRLAYTREMDEKKLSSDRRTKLWSQLTIFIPVVVLLISFFLNNRAERAKDEREQIRRERANAEALKREKRAFIEKQLTEFYYPVILRLHKDNAVWELWNENQYSKERKNVAAQIERDFMLPNHEDAIKIIDSKFHLIRNDSDPDDQISKLIIEIRKYERHVALYKALRATGSRENPIDWNRYEDKYPKNLYYVIRDRINSLKKQHAELAPDPSADLSLRASAQ